MSKQNLNSKVTGHRFSAVFFGLLPIIAISIAGWVFGFYTGTIVILLLVCVLVGLHLKINYFYFDLYLDNGSIVLERPFPRKVKIKLSHEFKILPIEMFSYASMYNFEDNGNKYWVKLHGDSFKDMLDVGEFAKQKEVEFKRILKS